MSGTIASTTPMTSEQTLEGHGGAVSRRGLLLGVGGISAALALGVGSQTAAVAAPPKLRKGDRGAAVTELQNRLNAAKYWCGSADGAFGPTTQQAVYALQKAAGLGKDGVVGPKTYDALSRKVLPKAQITSGTAFEIDLDKQLLLCIAEGKIAYVLNTSTGSGERYYSGGRWKRATTPKGDFRIYRNHSKGWLNGSLGRMYRPSFWDRGWAIHGSDSIPPYPASHGCARISTAASDMLWKRNWFIIDRRVLVR